MEMATKDDLTEDECGTECSIVYDVDARMV